MCNAEGISNYRPFYKLLLEALNVQIMQFLFEFIRTFWLHLWVGYRIFDTAEWFSNFSAVFWNVSTVASSVFKEWN